METRKTFRQRSSIGDWQYYKDDNEVSPVEICNAEFRGYVDLPAELREVDIIFTDEPPVGLDSFEMYTEVVTQDDGPSVVLGGFRSERAIGWYTGTREFICDMYDKGYRYARIEY